MTTQTQVRRITIKLKTPNPLFEKWLIEWRDRAKETNSKMQFTFNNALKTLKKYPLPLNSGKDCIILDGFGNKLCAMLDKKLEEYKLNETNIEIDEHVTHTKTGNSAKKKMQKSLKNTRSYQPLKRSGAWAILITLLKESQKPQYNGSLTKKEIIEYGRHLCDKSFTKPDPGSFYTAWSSMKTLLSKGFVLRKGSPAKFNLTDEGEIIAIKLIENEEQLENNISTNFINNNETEEIVSSQISTTTESEIFAPNSFDVILLVDNQETNGGTKNLENDETIVSLKYLNVNFEVRHLKVGDFIWICRERNTKQELVLPYIVERKRMDDLGHSIKDGRFHEQKFRLKLCGIETLIYIVESYGSNSHTVLPLNSLMQGVTNTLIQDKFNVKFTDSHRHSMQYLCEFTLILKHIYEKKTLLSRTKTNSTVIDISSDLISLIPFAEFNKNASKQKKFSVKDTFIRQLLQLKGVSVEKALAIVEKYSSPKLLKMQYDHLGSEGEKLLATITYGPLKKSIGLAISQSIFLLYSKDIFR